MRAFAQWLETFVQSEDGPTAAQYALMLALIGAVCLGGVKALGTASNTQVNSANTMLHNAGS